VDFRILGRLEVLDGGVDVAPRRAQPRALLAMFLLHPNEPLATDRLIDALWGEASPATADKALQGHVSALRKALGHERLVTEHGGYRLVVEQGELDADRFAAAVSAGRALRDPGDRAAALAAALAMWRGSALADLAGERLVQAESARLASARLAALEAWADAEIDAGNHAAVLASLERLVDEHPLSEGLRASLMVGLYRAGRQSDALRAYRDGRRLLAEELGIDPGVELQRLEQQVLAHDPALEVASATTPERTPPRQERKVVTILVAEVIPDGASDPEDLEHAAQPALDRIRAQIEQVGGRAEPLFANALLGMFGAPRSHDDDAVRAVRTALQLLDDRSQPGFRIRGGIETGEALVTTDGDHVAITGHVLGAASRLQAAAPLGSVVVGAATHRATEDAIDYRPLADGGWTPIRVRRPGELARPESPFVGRAAELDQLERILTRARDRRVVQLVTITAEPGGGKSRLVRELRGRVDHDNAGARAGTSSDAATAGALPTRWLQGRCLPYGNGLTFWALGEIVKDWGGILESDDSTASEGKLAAALVALEPDDNRRTWLGRSISPLAGLGDDDATRDREHTFAAWRQWIENIAAEQPLVLVFEDIHWADEALLAFIDHLVDHAADVPLLVLCTARPELLETRPTWGAGKRNASAILLQPLSEAETGQLLHGLLGRAAPPATIRRAGGNPLFASELARVLMRSGTDEDPIPESLHAVIAAHLDALAPDLKAVAADASVVGEVFWPGILTELGGVDADVVDARLHRLIANDVIRRRRRSTVAGQEEYEFLHVLVRDVAYGQIPRRDRIVKHRLTATWIERLAEDRPTAHAELAAHHYVEALELARRLGDDSVIPDLQPRAVAALGLAGDGASTLDVARAESLYRQALDLTAGDDSGRGRLLGRLGLVTQFTSRPADAEALCRSAIATLESNDDREGAAAVMVNLVGILWRLGRAAEERRRLLLDAIAILEAAQSGRELVFAYSQMASLELFEGRAPSTRDWAMKAMALADRLGAVALKCEPLHYVGIARFEMGDLAGIDDLRGAVRQGLEAGLSWYTCNAQTDLGATLWLSEGPARGLAAKRDAATFAAERGLAYLGLTIRAESLWLEYDAGEWDRLLESADSLIEWGRQRGPDRVTMIALTAKARVLAARGEADAALELEDELLRRARALGDSQDLVPAFATAASIRSLVGDGAAAVELVRQLADATRDRDPSKRAHELPQATRVAVAWGAADLARGMVPDGEPNYLRSQLCIASSEAILAEADGDVEGAARRYVEAAAGWAVYGDPYEEAHALVGAGRCLVALGRGDDAATHLGAARRRVVALGAQPLVAEITRIEATTGR